MDGMPRSPVFSARTVDGLLCGALLVVGQSQVWAGWNDGGVGVTPHDHQLARAVLAVAFVLPLWWRRCRPLLAVGVICAAIAVQLVVVTPYVPFVAGLLPMAIANYTCAAYAARLRGVDLLAVLGAELVIYAAIPEERFPGEVLFSIFVALGTWVAGDVVRVRSERAERALGTARTIVAEREAANCAALADERARIARELHDVIAHSVSVMGVQAGAARLLLEHDPESARTAMLAIEDTARTSVAELQRLLAVLREDDTPDSRTPTPGLQQLSALVEQVPVGGTTRRGHHAQARPPASRSRPGCLPHSPGSAHQRAQACRGTHGCRRTPSQRPVGRRGPQRRAGNTPPAPGGWSRSRRHAGAGTAVRRNFARPAAPRRRVRRARHAARR